MGGWFVLFPPRRYIWETFCNFWHFSRRIFFFSHGGRSFLFCIGLCWWRCGAPKQFVSLALKGEGAGGAGGGGGGERWGTV